MKKLILIMYLIITSLSLAESIKAPSFSLQDQNLVTHSLEQYAGKNIFLIFWASWCGYCQEELEIINKLYAETGKNQKDIIFLTFNSDNIEDFNKFFKEKNYSFPIIRDETIFYQYYIDTFPTIYVIGKEGEVLQSITGKIDETNFKELLKNPNFVLKKK